MCCLHKQCHISVNIICHPDILDWIQFPLGFAQLGTWLLQQTANSIRAQCMSKADTHFYQMILVTPGMKRGFPVFSQPTSASRLSSDRSELTLPHQHHVELCGPQQPASPTHLPRDPKTLLRFISRALSQNIMCVPAALGSI